MGDQLEGNVAIVALIVSLIALFIAGNQLLLQLFNSADGYRRCAESVIDAWHIRRHRKWKWFEFRFETQYVTPQIILTSPQERQNYEERHSDMFLINSLNLGDGACDELNKTVHQEYCHMGARRRPPARASDVSSKQASDPRSAADIEKGQTESELFKNNDAGIAESDFSSSCDEKGNERSNLARTDIAVIYRTWTWDFMPPDMVRPLAETNIGDIIVLALRMGMQWRALEPENGKMQADGNGFSLTATDVRGLGIVLRFNSAGSHDDFPRIVPGRGADKMLFGIVPGDPILVGNDFPLVSKKGEIEDVTVLLTHVGLVGTTKYSTHEPEVFNDTITLLLPFLPLGGSTITSYCFPAWRIQSFIRGVHFYWESRLAFHRRLRERVQNTKGNKDLFTSLNEVLERMDILEKRHSDYWYSRWLCNPAMRKNESWKDKLAAIDDMREIFQWTTQYLVDASYDEAHIDGSKRYVHLVAAHAHMAHYATKEASAFEKHYPHSRSQQATREAYKITSHHGYFFAFNFYELGQRYVDYLLHSDFGVAANLEERGICLTVEEVEVAWWVMQLRGIVWSMSAWHPDGVVQQILGTPVPSSFYGNKTPVWIT
ncbi:hypothetical protein N0V90_006865 [Kalmusia sp. IMI 367209]|nr:hypothetical protein N0V90_006865 [Kalmusia sp. IMI 367209]